MWNDGIKTYSPDAHRRTIRHMGLNTKGHSDRTFGEESSEWPVKVGN